MAETKKNRRVLRCITCGRLMQEGETVYRVGSYEVLNGELKLLFSPACSIACARTHKEESVSRIESMLHDVKNMSIQSMLVEDYFR